MVRQNIMMDGHRKSKLLTSSWQPGSKESETDTRDKIHPKSSLQCPPSSNETPPATTSKKSYQILNLPTDLCSDESRALMI
jgi:hypothetical protein